MTRTELINRRDEIISAASEAVIDWDRYEGVVATGVGENEDTDADVPYTVRVYILKGIRSDAVPRSVNLRLRWGEVVVLPVQIVPSSRPRG